MDFCITVGGHAFSGSCIPGRYLGPDYGDGERKGPQDVVTAAQVPFSAKQSFPLCMQVQIVFSAHPRAT